ncbi:hypothetical protein BX070DRAFT_219980 [Coemansia spiralis]|nr:hypothetical protein BX070DRAFT_219980 [Coemansia spiralis]
MNMQQQQQQQQQAIPPLTFIPAPDLLTYAKTFQGNVASGSTRISGDAARRVLMQSRLPVNELGRIWELSDVRRAGSLSMAEFMLAMFLAQSRIRGKMLPDSLPPKILSEIDAANSVAGAAVAPMATPALAMPTASAMQIPPMAAGMPLAPQRQQASTPMNMSARFGANSAQSIAAASNVESVQSFETRYPDIAPTTGAAGPNQGALSSVKQSFAQNMLGGRAGESQHQWAIAGAERAQYESIFRRWDPGHRGALGGDQAREVFAQSGLPQHELAKVWSLADITNQGELNLDEFSVAMHLIFRRLAGAQIPDHLPAELVPRSSRNFMDSLKDMKDQLMFKDISKGSPSTRATPRSYSAYSGRADSRGYDSDNDNDSSTYKSANRRRNNGRGSADPGTCTPPAGTVTAGAIEQLRRDIGRRKAEIAELKANIERTKKERAEARVTLRWRIDDIKRELEDIHRSTPQVPGDRGLLLAKRRKLVASISELVESMPELTTEYKRLAGDLAEARKGVAKKREAKDPGSGSDMESRAARLVAQRMAALTGQSLDELDGSPSSQLRDELEKIEKKHRESLERIESVTSGLSHVQRSMRDLKLEPVPGSGRWESGVKNEEVRELIERLKRIEQPTAKAAGQPASTGLFEKEDARPSAFSPVPPRSQSPAKESVVEAAKQGPSIAERLARATTKQERDKLLQEIAEERFRERQRALGLPEKEPAKPEPAKPEPAKPEPVKPEPVKLEMQQRAPAANADANLLDLPSEPVSAVAASNPFSNQSHASPQSQPLSANTVPVFSLPAAQEPLQGAAEPAEHKYASIFENSLEVNNYSEDSSEDEWDRDSSDEGDAAREQLPPIGVDAQAPKHDTEDSPESSVSFDTAFASPAVPTEQPANTAAVPVAKDESNPFVGLLLANSNNGAQPGDAAKDSDPVGFECLRVRALYPYSADNDELGIETGDLIETRPSPVASTHMGDGWMFGEILSASDETDDGWQPSGKRGWFPREYVETLGPVGSRGWAKTKAMFGTAKYDYQPQHEDELTVAVGDRVRVVDGDVAESWWKVRRIGSDNATGMLPAIYIDLDK